MLSIPVFCVNSEVAPQNSAVNDHIPGDVVTREEIKDAIVKVSAEIASGVICEVRVYADDKVICQASPQTEKVALEFKLEDPAAQKFIRVEAVGDDPEKVMVSTPFFIG